VEAGAGLEAIGLNASLAVLLRLVEHEVVVLSALDVQVLKRMESLLKAVMGALAVISLALAGVLLLAAPVAVVEHLSHEGGAPRLKGHQECEVEDLRVYPRIGRLHHGGLN